MAIPESRKSAPAAPGRAVPPPDATARAVADLAAEKERAGRLEARVTELQQQLRDLIATARTKDDLLAEGVQALKQMTLEQQALQAQAVQQLEGVRAEAALYRGIVDGVVQLGNAPALILSGGLGACVQAARQAAAAYPGTTPAKGSGGAAT